MAKLKGKAKTAFLRRMARGRSAAARRTNRGGKVRVRRRARRPGVSVVRRRRNPMSALIANPSFGYSPAYAAGYERTFGRKVRRRRKAKGASSMAKKRRKRRTRRAAPRKIRRRRGTAARRIRRARRVPRHRAHRYYKPRGKRRIYLNPRRRRVRRRRNPGFGGGGSLLKRVLVPYAAGFLASAATAVLDTGLAEYPMVRNVAKVGAAFLIAIAGRRYPTASIAAISALAGTQGYALGTKVAGGFIARNPKDAVTGLGEMSRAYPEIGALLSGGVGALLSGMGDPSDPDAVIRNYASAMQNMANDDDE